MTDRVAGERLRRWVLAEAKQRDIHSVLQLADEAGVGRDTLQAWWRGRYPGPTAGEKVARALGKSYKDLLNAREGAAKPVELTMPDDEYVERVAQRTAELLLERLGRGTGRGGSGQS